MNWQLVLHTLEGLSYIATLFLLGVAFYGLKQIKVSKDISKVSAKRDALKVSSERAHYYSKDIIPLIDDLDDLIMREKITILYKSAYVLNDDSISVDFTPNGKEGMRQFEIISGKLVQILNELDSFAAYFISGVGDEEVTYKSIGKTYISSVNKYMPVIGLLHGNGSFGNIIELYRIWLNRSQREGLEKQKRALEDKINETQDIYISPFGADK